MFTNTEQARNRQRPIRASIVSVLLGCLFVAACSGIPTRSERAARDDLHAVGQVFRPSNARPALPELTESSSLGDYLRFAMLNQPEVEAAYYEWAAAVEHITQERSLSDPQFTFESDIIDQVVMTVMPGLMQEFPGPGKLRLRADVASSESRAKYFAFESSVLQTALAVKRAYYQLYFLEEMIRVNRGILLLLDELERIARAQNEVAKVTLQDVLRAQIEQDRVITEIANLEDSRNPLVAQFKAALGLTVEQSDPPLPARFETTPLDVTSDQLLFTAFARNPVLKMMEADVGRATAALELAYRARIPDFGLGLMVDVDAAPVMFRPLFNMTLPIWRDKIAAEIAEAQASKQAAAARLTSEQITITVSFAEKTFSYREITRTLDLLQNKLLPKAQQSLEVARAGYLAGTIDFFNLIDSERTLLMFHLEEVQARTRRELVLAELSLMILGQAPEQAPILDRSGSSVVDSKYPTR